MTERDIAQKAIDAVLRGTLAFCKFLSANDTGETGGHQSGIYIPKTSVADYSVRSEHALKRVQRMPTAV
jgi:type II restriction enzyme